MPAWTTDDIPAQDRFSIWREWFGPIVLGAETNLGRDHRKQFKASFAAKSIGSALLVDIDAVACTIRRSSQDIARGMSDSLFIFLQSTGPGWSVNTGRSEFVLGGSHITYGYSDLPFETAPSETTLLSTRLLRIPLQAVHDPGDYRFRMSARELRPTPGAASLFAAYVPLFLQEAPYMEGDAAETAIDTLRRLALLAQPDAEAPGDTPGGRDAMVAGQLYVVQQFIRRNLSRPDLSVETVSRALRVSPRHLHRLFEPTGTTFARFVLCERLDNIAAQLVLQPRRSVLDIAFAAGFNSSSAFYRAFSQRYEMRPQDYRFSVR